jgi:hypothetical protein
VKWYQLHLSTLPALMLLAAVLVWLNVRDCHVHKNWSIIITDYSKPEYFKTDEARNGRGGAAARARG